MNKTMKNILSMLWKFVKIDLLCWVIYVCSSMLIVLIFYHDVPAGHRDFTPIFWFLHLIYFIAYHQIFTVAIENEKVKVDDSEFSIKLTVTEFFRNDRMQIIMLAVFAAIFEVAMIIGPSVQNLVATLFVMFIPSAGAIPIPVLRTVIGFTISLASMLLSTILIRYKKHKYWNSKK